MRTLRVILLTVTIWGGVVSGDDGEPARLIAHDPNPPDGATSVDPDTDLVWVPGAYAFSHEVYLGTSKEGVANGTGETFKGRQEAATFDPGVLDSKTTYYWRIDEIEHDATIHAGAVWCFTTASFVVIDDFESYTDDVGAGEAIFQTWIDGLGPGPNQPGNGTGGYVGYPITDWDAWGPVRFCHSAVQSMPFDYSNTFVPYYSEAERTWNAPQDWTVDGVTHLSLWVLGNPPSFWERPNGNIVMGGCGWGVAGSSDWFRYGYKHLKGDGSIVAAVKRVYDAGDGAEAGVMIRETLDPGGRHAAVLVSATGGLGFVRRSLDNEESLETNVAGIQAAQWVRLTRAGDTFTAQHSGDGVAWRDVTDSNGDPVSMVVSMPNRLFIGLAVVAGGRHWWSTTSAEFSHVVTTGDVSGRWQLARGVWPFWNEPDSLYVALEDKAGGVGVSIHPDPEAVLGLEWAEWRIALGDFSRAGVDVAAVKKMVIGAGDRNDPAPGGGGLIHIDDIRLIKSEPRAEPDESSRALVPLGKR